ncbi:MAG: tetratricopeptide repeat protein, partial [Pseudomonadota bacterium]
WFRNKNRNISITIDTPTVTAGIRGTELNLAVGFDKTTVVSVIEGRVFASNPAGSMMAEKNETITARSGLPLEKTLLLNPADAVQWTITLPPLTETWLTIADPGRELLDLIRSRRMNTAQELLETIVGSRPENAAAWSWLALVRLLLGQKNQALEAAQKGISLAPGSTAGLIILSYAWQGVFDLGKARETLDQVLTLEPDNCLALVNAARLEFGTQAADRAESLMARAHALCPGDPEVLTLSGYLALARQDYDSARGAFVRAIAANPQTGEAFMGLALLDMRAGRTDLALKEIATAVLLEPQRSVFVSYWAKMLYQMKRFDRALELLDTAQTLDANDPTPHLYRAIILRDLNRSGEAVASLNRAIELNDRRAVYRSRFLLDQDLAVKNVNQSIIYNQLGLSAWAMNKAMTSVKTDYGNASGHIFLGGALLNLEGRLQGASSETLLGMILQPANINALNTFQEYTSFFEQPDTTTIVSGTAAGFDTKTGSLLFLGSLPGKNMAVSVLGSALSTDGWQGDNGRDQGSLGASLKWDPTPDDGLLVAASSLDSDQYGRFTRRYDYDAPPAPDDDFAMRTDYVKAGFHHRFSKDMDLILYTKYTRTRPDFTTHYAFVDETDQSLYFSRVDEEDVIHDIILQGQILYRAGRHQVIAGMLHENWRQSMDATDSDEMCILYPDGYHSYFYEDTTSGKKDDRFHTTYVQDIWKISPDLTLEAALYWDVMQYGSVYHDNVLNFNNLNPRLGLIYALSTSDTLRAAAFQYLIPSAVERVDPSDIAGIPVIRNNYNGSRTSEIDLVWEHEWKKAFALTNLYYTETLLSSALNDTDVTRDHVRVKGFEEIVNILATDWAGLGAGYRYLDINNPSDPGRDRKDHRVTATLTLNFPSGFYGGLSQTFRCQDMDHEGTCTDETIWTTDLAAGYQFPGKKGGIKLAATNLFDAHFNWIADDFVFSGKDPERQFGITLFLVF